MKKLSYIVSTLLLIGTLSAQNISIKEGWQLLGAVDDINVSKFNDTCVDHIWKYSTSSIAGPEWQIHIANGINYNHSYTEISLLNSGDGFWVKGNNNANCIVSPTLINHDAGIKRLITIYNQYATIFADCNNNDVLDVSETKTTTDADGLFSFDTPISCTDNYKLVAMNDGTSFIDGTTNSPYILFAPSDFTVISELSTLISSMIDANISLEGIDISSLRLDIGTDNNLESITSEVLSMSEAIVNTLPLEEVNLINNIYPDFNISDIFSDWNATIPPASIEPTIDINDSFTVTVTAIDAYVASIIITHNEIIYGAVLSPYTQRIWLDRNLGASQACTALDDTACYGDYYQWGRGADGHEKSDSITTSMISLTNNTLATSIVPNHNKFILSSGYYTSDEKYVFSDDYKSKFTTDWTLDDASGITRSLVWSSTNGSSICPVGFRVPSKEEFEKELIGISNKNDAFDKLKLPITYTRNASSGEFSTQEYGTYWASNPSEDTQSSYTFNFSTEGAFVLDFISRATGLQVRCIKD